MDLGRFLAMSLLVGAYFALVLYRREQGRWPAGGPAQAAPAESSERSRECSGSRRGPCSVVGFGAPVHYPVVGLVFAGLSSGTLALCSPARRAS